MNVKELALEVIPPHLHTDLQQSHRCAEEMLATVCYCAALTLLLKREK